MTHAKRRARLLATRVECAHHASRMIHVGRKVLKSLAADGWREENAYHMGRGIWLFVLTKEPA